MADEPGVAAPRPKWVKLGLWGVSTRQGAMGFLWLSTVLAVATGAYGLRDERFFFGLGLFAATAWYWLAIRWVDQHGGW